MMPNLCPSRFFHTSDGWYVYMRPGDEKQCSYCGLHKVKFAELGDRLVAGPFRKEHTMRRWFENFILTYGFKSKRTSAATFIPNEVILPEWTPFDGDLFQYDTTTQPANGLPIPDTTQGDTNAYLY